MIARLNLTLSTQNCDVAAGCIIFQHGTTESKPNRRGDFAPSDLISRRAFLEVADKWVMVNWGPKRKR